MDDFVAVITDEAEVSLLLVNSNTADLVLINEGNIVLVV